MTGRSWWFDGARRRFARAVRPRLSTVFEIIASDGADLVQIATMIGWGYDDRLWVLTPFAQRLSSDEIFHVLDDEVRAPFHAVRERAHWVSLSSVHCRSGVYSRDGLCMRVAAIRVRPRQLCHLVGFARPIELECETQVMPALMQQGLEAHSHECCPTQLDSRAQDAAAPEVHRDAAADDLPPATGIANVYHLRMRERSGRRGEGERT